jgi:hypothetical protein
MNYSMHSIVVATSGNISCQLEEDLVILHLGEGMYYGLNSVGARIWELIQEPRTVNAVRAQLLEEYDVEPDECTRELGAILVEMADKGLVEVRDGPSL